MFLKRYGHLSESVLKSKRAVYNSKQNLGTDKNSCYVKQFNIYELLYMLVKRKEFQNYKECRHKPVFVYKQQTITEP